MKTEDKCDTIYETARCHIPEDYNLDIFHPENRQSVSPQNTVSLFTTCPRLRGLPTVCALKLLVTNDEDRKYRDKAPSVRNKSSMQTKTNRPFT